MSSIPSDLFKGMGNARMTYSGMFYQNGSFISLLKGVKFMPKTYAKKSAALIFEHKIIAVRSPGATLQGRGVGASAVEAKPGVEVAHIISQGTGKQEEMFLPNVKTALTELVRLQDPRFNPDALDDDGWFRVIDLVAGTEQRLSGVFIGVVANQVIIASTGNPFTRISYDAFYTARRLRETLKNLGQSEEITFPPGALDAMIAEEDAKAVAAAEAAAAKAAAESAVTSSTGAPAPAGA